MNVIKQAEEALEDAAVYGGDEDSCPCGGCALGRRAAATLAALRRYEVVEGAAVCKNGEWRVTPDNPFGLERPAILLVEREPSEGERA
ncbi:MAG: hypothetical protein AMXMBFR53_30120 [Gemmatimonadota bacterium]